MSQLWTEHRNADGRLYWHNKASGESSWEKPETLRTPSERALASTAWKSYETADGRKYYVHASTQQTTWDVPTEVHEALALLGSSSQTTQSNVTPLTSQVTPAVSSPFISAGLTPHSGAVVTAGSIVPIGSASGPDRLHAASLNGASLDFGSTEEAVKAFMGLLRSKGVTPSWTWEQTMREVVTDPLYKALRNLADRKSAFERYVDEYRKREKDARERNLERIRPAWREGLGRATEGEGGMKSWWSWEHSKQALSEGLPEMWRMARDDDERRVLWEEYVTELRRKEELRDRDLRQKNIEKLHGVLRRLDLELSTSWQSARRAIERSSEWSNDVDLRSMAPFDQLSVFEDIIRDLERSIHDTRQKQKEERRRRSRKARESFVSLLHELRLAGQIKAGTTWTEIYPRLNNEERYRQLLGKTGSSPIDLFRDMTDELEREIEADHSVIKDCLKESMFSIQANTEIDEFMANIRPHPKCAPLDDARLAAIFDFMHASVVRKTSEERHHKERKRKSQMDDLRYALRRIEPPIVEGTTYDTALPAISVLPEYIMLEDNEARKLAFDKYVRRLKDKNRDKDYYDNDSRGGSPALDRKSRHDSNKPISTVREGENEDRKGYKRVSQRHHSREHDSDRDRDRRDDDRLTVKPSKRDREDLDERRRSVQGRRDRYDERRDLKRSRREDDREEGEI